MNKPIAACVAMLLGSTPAAHAAQPDDIEQLQRQLQALKQDYQQRITELEQRLLAAEQAVAASATTPAAADPSAVAASASASPATGGSATESRFNPAISLILDGRYKYLGSDDGDYALAGFPLNGEAVPAARGFALGHSELVISANADDKFFGRFTAAFDVHDGETEVEVEEAFLETLAMPLGFKVRAGRFFSDIGYLNSRHPHQWDFADAPLVYRGLFGNQLLDDGLRLSWLAPTDHYLEVGSELFRGSHYPIESNGDSTVPAYTLFAKFGGDIGISNSWQAGLSLLDAELDSAFGETAHGHDHADIIDDHVPPGFAGDAVTWGFDLVWKWAPRGNNRQRNLTLQYEYFHRDYDGVLSADEEGSADYDGSQSGWYAQAVYQFRPRWRVGLRYDSLTSSLGGTRSELAEEAGLDSSGYDPSRYSLMADWSNSEFSRLRLQYGYDKSSLDSDSYWIAQYILSLGAHGAHRF